MTTLRQAAQAVVERWDEPLWRDLQATGNCIAVLRTALEAPEQEPDLYRSYIAVCEELVKRTEDRDALENKVDQLELEITRLHYEIDAIPAIKEERDAMMAAGNLALESLMSYKTTPMSNQQLAKLLSSINALKAAGVE